MLIAWGSLSARWSATPAGQKAQLCVRHAELGVSGCSPEARELASPCSAQQAASETAKQR